MDTNVSYHFRNKSKILIYFSFSFLLLQAIWRNKWFVFWSLGKKTRKKLGTPRKLNGDRTTERCPRLPRKLSRRYSEIY